MIPMLEKKKCECTFVRFLHRMRIMYHLRVGCGRLTIYTKATTKTTKQRVITNESTKEMKEIHNKLINLKEKGREQVTQKRGKIARLSI